MYTKPLFPSRILCKSERGERDVIPFYQRLLLLLYQSKIEIEREREREREREIIPFLPK